MDKNELLEVFSTSMGNSKDKFIAFVELKHIQDYETIIKEFVLIQATVYAYIYKITEPNLQLSGTEIEDVSRQYCINNYPWMNEKGVKAINSWLIWMCWHDGILK